MQDTKKFGCGAQILLKEIIQYADFQVSNSAYAACSKKLSRGEILKWEQTAKKLIAAINLNNWVKVSL